MRLELPAVVILSLTAAACGPAASEGGFDSANPAARMYAIEQAARAGDAGAVRRIVESLDSDDPAVRSLAIATLKRLTGETFDYRDYDPPHLRGQAVDRWVEAVESGRIQVTRETPATSPSSHGTTLDAVPHYG